MTRNRAVQRNRLRTTGPGILQLLRASARGTGRSPRDLLLLRARKTLPRLVLEIGPDDRGDTFIRLETVIRVAVGRCKPVAKALVQVLPEAGLTQLPGTHSRVGVKIVRADVDLLVLRMMPSAQEPWAASHP